MLKKQQFELYMGKNWSVQDREKSKRGLAAVTLFVSYRLSTSSEMPGWMNYKPEWRFGRVNINKLRYVYDITLIAENEEELKSR